MVLSGARKSWRDRITERLQFLVSCRKLERAFVHALLSADVWGALKSGVPPPQSDLTSR